MSRYVAREGGYPPRNQDFDQSLPSSVYESRIAAIQGLIVHPAREQTVDVPAVGTEQFDRRPVQKRQSRVTVTLVEPDPALRYEAAKPSDPDIGVRFSRKAIKKSPIHGTLQTLRRLEGTALHERTTINLSGMEPLIPNAHPNLPHQEPEISNYRLAVLTTGEGGLKSSTLRSRYLRLSTKRQAQLMAPETPAQTTVTSEIPWESAEPSPLFAAILAGLNSIVS